MGAKLVIFFGINVVVVRESDDFGGFYGVFSDVFGDAGSNKDNLSIL